MIQLDRLYLKITRALKYIWNFFYNYRKIFLIWAIITLFISVSVALGIDKSIIAFIVLAFGLVTQAFIGLLNLIALIPIIGPLLAKVLALPIYWILNSIGYFLSVIAIKKGHSKAVLHYRILTVVFLIGLAFGFVLGKLI